MPLKQKSKAAAKAKPKKKARIEVYEDEGGEYRWGLVGRNGQIMDTPGEGYTRRSDAKRAFHRVREAMIEAEIIDV
jgi:uncharacterized protein YegP (UPF0339 family)